MAKGGEGRGNCVRGGRLINLLSAYFRLPFPNSSCLPSPPLSLRIHHMDLYRLSMEKHDLKILGFPLVLEEGR